MFSTKKRVQGRLFGAAVAALAGLLAMPMSMHAKAEHAAESDLTSAPWRMYVNGWTFAPVWDGPRVTAFLAVADEGSNQGANFEVVWFEQDASGRWVSSAWFAGYRASAYRWVENLIGDPECWNDDVEAMDVLLNDRSEFHAPMPLHAGLLLADPVQEILNTSR
ncbi:MAG: hypothetical protein KF787_06615 [Phycisphaeraceae bacterium]|nr:hypothetical protein [Phycisphaerae bacterium]MBX3392305.1 hypothetical protein [Phycisphaeraceae bacterium]HRJ49093.1 hypothetical protein [Phycisphaerales bacterium]